jgi:hypothetical protein
MGYVHGLVVIDGFTRFPWVIPLKDKRPETIADGLFTQIFSFTGLPKRFHCDNDFALTSKVLEILFKKWGVKQTFISYRHPCSNGIAERFMRYINASLTLTLPKYTDWPRSVMMILFAYRNVVHASTGYTPAYLMFGRNPLMPLALIDGSDPLENIGLIPRNAADYANQLTKELVKSYETVRELQKKATERNRISRNTDRFSASYNVGDSVLLWDPKSTVNTVDIDRPKPSPGLPAIRNIPEAWKYKWSGPHVVTAKISDTTYRIHHTVRQRTINANVDSMHLIDPTSDYDIDIPPPPRPHTLHEVVSPDIPPIAIHSGDLCALRLKDDVEPLVIARYLGLAEDPNFIVCQWCGSYQDRFHDPEDRLIKMKWKNGWLQPKDTRFYWKSKSDHPSHTPFTNLISEHLVPLTDILHFGFGLRPDFKLATSDSTIIIDKWRKSIAGRPNMLSILPH